MRKPGKQRKAAIPIARQNRIAQGRKDLNYKPLAHIGRRLKQAYKWEKFKPTKEWVEENVELKSDAAAMSGPMQLKYTPHLIEMFDDYDRPEVWKQVLMVSSQTQKTTYQFCCAAKSLDKEVAPGQLMIPTAKGIPRYLTKKLNPFMDGVKSVKSKMIDYSTTEKLRNRGAELRVPGGGLSVTGSSPGERKSLSVKYFFADEIGEFDEGAVPEAEERTKTFEKFFRKIILASTRVSPNDEISREFYTCETKKRLEIQCFHCGKFFYPDHTNIKYLKKHEYAENNGLALEDVEFSSYLIEGAKSVKLECEHCKTGMTTAQKDRQVLNKKIRWHIESGPKDGKSIGYRANAIPMYFTTMEYLAELLIKAEEADNKQAILDKIHRGYFNNFYKTDTKETDTNDILLCSNGLEESTLPNDTYRVYMGIDTQKDHFWWTIKAFEYGGNNHTILYGRAETTSDLEMIMGMTFKDQKGRERGVDKVGIDRQGIKERTVEVDNWVSDLVVRQGLQDFIYLTMGIARDTSMRPYVEFRLEKDLTTNERRETPLKGIKLNNLLLKNELNNTIQRSIKKSKEAEEASDFEKRLYFINKTTVRRAEERSSAGIKSVSTDYERQMTSEEYVYKIDKRTGKTAKEQTWEKKSSSIDNHYWDCEVICMAFAMMDRVYSTKKPQENESPTSALKNLIG